ncbi:MAG: methyltransferase domain-containing protein [Nitrososphaerota archaeon]|nr:methyltransferase domain-containing protein [Nitrososphaerota archaeon]
MARLMAARDNPPGTGPLPLEERVDPEWWKRIFNGLYLVTDGDVVCNRRLTEREVDLIVKLLDLGRDDRVLDLCCGNGRHSLELARRGFSNVHGLDYSRELLQVAETSALREGLTVRFRRGDARRLPYRDDQFDAVILMGNSFGYFRDESDDLRVLRETRRVLRPYGKLLIDVTDGEAFRAQLSPVRAETHDGAVVVRLRELSSDGKRVYTREIVVSGDSVLADQVYGIRLYTFGELRDLLQRAGFVNVSLVARLTYDPDDKDPGLMGSRMVVTALAAKPARGDDRRPLVVVLLGDPRRPNPVKPGGRFDEDDEAAVNELKSALYGIDDYKFVILDDHSAMLRFLQENADSIHLVLNLCDDGFLNDPRMEGHVAAVLEVLGIRYTGAGPACLNLCYDKSAVKAIARSIGVPVLDHALVRSPDDLRRVPGRLFPCIVKPNFGDNSWGITERSVARDTGELRAAVRALREEWGYEGPVLVERFVEGRDLTVSAIGNPPDLHFLPVLEEDYSRLPDGLPRILTYDAKWNPGSPYGSVESVPAKLPDGVRGRLFRWSSILFERLGCRDYARFDWRLDAKGGLWLLEANPNPGWVWDGHFRKACWHAGWTYERMFREIIRAAERRYGLKGDDRPFRTRRPSA